MSQQLNIRKGDRVSIKSQGVVRTGIVDTANHYPDAGWMIEMTCSDGPCYWKQRADGGEIIGYCRGDVIKVENLIDAAIEELQDIKAKREIATQIANNCKAWLEEHKKTGEPIESDTYFGIVDKVAIESDLNLSYDIVYATMEHIAQQIGMELPRR
jgi:hypothetical protein